MREARPWTSGKLLVGGEASGQLVALSEPLSFWGGVDEKTGVIIDGHHPQVGTFLAGCALLMGATSGSSSSTSTLLECSRRGTAPSLLLLTDPDPILVVAAVVAWDLYDHGPSVVLLSEGPDPDGVALVRVDTGGRVFAICESPVQQPTAAS